MSNTLLSAAMENTDIQNRQDIEALVDAFYKRVLRDPIIGHFFNDVVELDWEKHIPTMYDFWESVLFGQGHYRGNPVRAHVALHRKSRLQQRHFEHWRTLFEATVDDLFAGPMADSAKEKARMMEQLLWYKVSESERNTFIQ